MQDNPLLVHLVQRSSLQSHLIFEGTLVSRVIYTEFGQVIREIREVNLLVLAGIT